MEARPQGVWFVFLRFSVAQRLILSALSEWGPAMADEKTGAKQGNPLVIFTPSGKRGHVEAGTSVLEAARRLGVDLDSVCGGRGICSRCQIAPAFGDFPKHAIRSAPESLSPWNEVEERYRSKRGLKEGRRLGCQARILGDVVIDVPPESQLHRQLVRKEASARQMVMDPATRLYYVELDKPDMETPIGALERLEKALSEQWGIERLIFPPALLPALREALDGADQTCTAALNQPLPDAPHQLIALWPGWHEAPLYGLAIDLGSTTIAAHLSDLKSGEVLASGGIMNPQIRFGEDLMSRVSWAMLHPEGTAEMRDAVREALADLARSVAAEAGLEPEQIFEAVIVGNPVMHHLLLGIDPTDLGQAPFALTVSGALELAASEIGLGGLHPRARAFILPLIAGHVGADAAAVILSEAPHKSRETVLIVDVGTNAELVLGNRQRLLACSSPTGPAFEGAQISAGQRAAPGAIEKVRIDPQTREPRFKVIGCEKWSDEEGFEAALGDLTISGICGSGIIEAVAEMRMAGLVDASGLIGSAQQTGSARMIGEGRTHAYLLHDGTAKGGPRIMITQGDVRAIQLAKSALYAGARLLMDELGIDRPDKVVLAGAFGAHISPLHALVLGMIPDVAPEHVVSAGNAAGTGARMALASRAARAEIIALVPRITKIETALAPRFQEHFVAANALPHATEGFEMLRKAVPLPDVSHNPAGAKSASGRRRRRR